MAGPALAQTAPEPPATGETPAAAKDAPAATAGEKAPDAAKPDEKAPDAAKPDEAKPDEAKPDEAKPDAAEATGGADAAAPTAPPAEPLMPSDPQPAKGATGSEEPPSADASTSPGTVTPSEVYAEDWWRLSRPVFELHGYFRVRSQFFHNFSLGRKDAIKPLWPQPPDKSYVDVRGEDHTIKLCGADPEALEPCDSDTQAGADMRFRFSPELHISDNLRIRSQIDLLDNIVLGSTPEGYANVPDKDGTYRVVGRGGYSPTGAFAKTQWAPTSGINSLKDSITVKRVWGEYATPLGQLRFGRMPSHWGLGMLVNGGDGYDADYQSTADRLMFVTGVRAWDLYFGAAWDFANEGATSALFTEQQGQPYDLAQSDDVDQWVLVVVRKRDEKLARRDLADGKVVINGGAYLVYRQQTVANDVVGVNDGASLGQSGDNLVSGYQRRGAEAVIPDLWFQLRFEKFRFELEAAMIYGSIENTLRGAEGSNYPNDVAGEDDGYALRQFGITTQAEYRAIDDRLKIGFGFGYASGDDDVESIAPTDQELQPQLTLDRTYSTFRFHPNYHVDMILFRNVLSRVQGAYYFRPSIEYDFIRNPNGQRAGGGASVIWSRASEFVQAPGNASDLGIELNVKLHFQTKDGVLNDDPNKMGGFYAQFEYGVLFPLDGLGYLPGEVQDYEGPEPLDTETAQALRLYLGILF